MLLFLASAASAQEGLTEDAAVARALEAHPGLTQARISVRRAEVTLQAEEGLLVPQLRIETSWLSNNEPTEGLFESGIRESDLYQTNASVSWRLPWGSDVSIQTDAARFKARQPIEFGGQRQTQTIGPNWQEHLNLTLRQPLLRGFGEDVNLASENIARERVELARAQLAQTASAAVLEVLAGFYELSYAQRDVAIKQRQLEIARDQREATIALVEAGTLAPIEIDVVDQRIVVLEEALLLVEHDLDGKARDLGRLLDAPVGATSPHFGTRGAPPPLPELLETAYAASPELGALREQIDAQRLVLGTRDDAVLPQLDLTASVGQNGLDKSFGGAAGQVLGLDATRWYLGAVFTMPLDNERAHKLVESDRLELDRLKVDLQATRERLRVDIEKARGLVAVNDRRLVLTEKSVVLAGRTLDAERARFKAGRSTNQRVLQYQEELERAEVRHARTQVDRELSLLRLDHLTGGLLRRFGLELSP
jgi:outer membrane protein